jgi:type IV pilus assembly protein PilC
MDAQSEILERQPVRAFSMVFFSSSLSGLIQWCRALKHGLHAGLSLPHVFHLQAKKGPRSMRLMAERIAGRLERGEALEDAFEQEGGRQLPKLFLEMAGVGERTGHLPEIFGELAEYYELQRKLGREFKSQIVWPVFQFFAAVAVIALLIWILGMIAESRGGAPIAPIGFGLTGAQGAVTFLIAVGVFLGSLFALYLLFTRGLRQRALFEAFLLRLPVIGPCADAFAMGRFCIALRMTMETGMSAHEALRQSLRATGNAAFAAHEESVVALIKSGQEINVSMQACTAFTEEFLNIVAVAEVGGQIPEVMIRQTEYYREEAARRLRNLTKFAGYGVWCMVAILLIVAIFKVAQIYVGALNQAAG